jgi:hypothetical protein
MGQTKDDHPAYCANGNWDVLLHLEIKELRFAPILVYTHVGIPESDLVLHFDGMSNPQSLLPITDLFWKLLYLSEGHETTLEEYLNTIPKVDPTAFWMLDHSFQNAELLGQFLSSSLRSANIALFGTQACPTRFWYMPQNMWQTKG